MATNPGILVYSYFAPLANEFEGGAQRWLDGLLRTLDGKGLSLTVVCPPANGAPLAAFSRSTRVIDVLRTVDRQDVMPAELDHDLRVLHQLGAEADVIVSVDQHYPLPTPMPIVLCLSAFCYGPEARSVFGLNWDLMLVPSEYLRACVDWYYEPRAWHGKAPAIEVIPHAVEAMDEIAGPVPDLDPPALGRNLVFPRRPDPDKGFTTAVRAVAELARRGHEYELLVPTPDPDRVWPHQRLHMGQRRRLVSELGVERLVRFHRWIAKDEMPAYLRMAEWSLCPSELPESFGLAVLEAVQAGVPVVATPAGAVRETLPPGHGVTFVEFGDARGIADAIVRGASPRALALGRAYVRERYVWDRYAARFLDLVGSARKVDGRFRPAPRSDAVDPPWLHWLPSGRTWDDFRKAYIT